MADEEQFLKAVGASLSADGQIAELQFMRADGSTAYVHFPVTATGGLLMNIEHALGQLSEKQQAVLEDKDPRTFIKMNAKRVATIQGVVAQDVPIVSFTLPSNVRINLALDRKQIRELAEWLLGLEASLDQPPPARN
jgi:hypothetical protein